MFGRPQHSQTTLSWPQMCIGCGHMMREDLELFKFHAHERKVVDTVHFGNMVQNTYANFDLDVPALLCRNCYFERRKTFIIRLSLVYPIILGIFFVPINIMLLMRFGDMAAYNFLIFTIICYGIYALIALWYFRKRFNPAKSFLKLDIKYRNLQFKFKSAKYAAAFKISNPTQQVIFPKGQTPSYLPSEF